jgi:carboxymethylenebutenolidase
MTLLIALLMVNTVHASPSEIVTEEIVYYQNSKNVNGYFARPSDNQKHPALILIHEWWGLNNDIRRNARKFAELGYAALAVDLYEGSSATTREEAKKLATGVRDNIDEAFRNLKSAITFVKSRPNVDSERVAAIGWCFGGGWSYQMAKNNLGVKASVIYYGRFNPKDDLNIMKASILGHFGEKDRSITVDTVHEFQARLKTLGGDHEIYIYENAGHAFANENGSRYDKDAAELAWNRTKTFLRKHL